MVVPVPAILLLGPQLIPDFTLLSAYLCVLVYLTHTEISEHSNKSNVNFGLSAAPVASYFVYREWVWVNPFISLMFSLWKKDQYEISSTYLLTLYISSGWDQCLILSTSNVGPFYKRAVAYPAVSVPLRYSICLGFSVWHLSCFQGTSHLASVLAKSYLV